MKKHIIFDVDGTLLDSEEAVLLSFQETLYRKTGKKTDIRDLKYALGIPSEAALGSMAFLRKKYRKSWIFGETLHLITVNLSRFFPESGSFWKSSKKTVPDWG